MISAGRADASEGHVKRTLHLDDAHPTVLLQCCNPFGDEWLGKCARTMSSVEGCRQSACSDAADVLEHERLTASVPPSSAAAASTWSTHKNLKSNQPSSVASRRSAQEARSVLFGTRVLSSTLVRIMHYVCASYTGRMLLCHRLPWARRPPVV